MAFDKTAMRREKAARMEVSGIFSDIEIAETIGITVGGLATMKRTPEYREILIRVKSGIIESMDDSIGEDTKALQKRIQDNIPIALNTIFDLVQQRSDRKLALQAAEVLIEVDGRFAKVQRIGNPTEAQGGVGAATREDELASAMVTALKKRTGAPASITDPPASEAVN